VRQLFLDLNSFREFLENIKRNIWCLLTAIENCALDEIIDKNVLETGRTETTVLYGACALCVR
jgi:hypothetical protein